MMAPQVVRSPQSMPPCLVVSSGRAGLAVARGLGELGLRVVVCYVDRFDLARASRYAAEAVAVPKPDQDDGAFVERLLWLARRFPGAALIPTSDDAVVDIARAQDELSRHFLVDCPAWDVAQRFIDKRHTYEIAERIGVPYPRTVVPDPSDPASAADLVPLPCLVKPRQSHLYTPHFDRKVTVVHTREELQAAHDEAAAVGVKVVLQELIDGPDELGVNYNSLRQSGRVVAECTARKMRLAPSRFGIPRVVRSQHVPEVVEPGRAVVEAMGLDGFACTEFKLDRRDGTYKLLEVNGRHNFSSMLSIRCGLNFPYLSYLGRTGNPVPEGLAARDGPFWVDELRDLVYSATRGGRDSRRLPELARPWLSRPVFAVFDRRDPAPFAQLLAGTVARLGSRGSDLDPHGEASVVDPDT